MKSRGLKIIVFGMVSLAGLHVLLFWGGSGSVFELIQGNLPPAVKLADRAVSLTGGHIAKSVELAVTVNTRQAAARVLPEYLSFTLDTSQLVGGKWWNPKADQIEAGSGTKHAPVFDFNRVKLDTLVSGLVPAYLRIGGSEADKVYYDLGDRRPYVAAREVPAGYHQTLTARQWDDLNAFVRRNNLKFVFTLNSGPSARNKDKSWNPANAEALMRYSREKGYSIDVFELGNEHNLFWYIYGLGGIVDTAQYQADLLVLRDLMRTYYPEARMGSQGSAIWPVLGELLGAFFGFYKGMIEKSGRDLDVIAWHYYPQQSRRGPFASRKAHPARLLDPENLDEAGHWAGVFTGLRDRHAPGRGIWLGETGNAQFGGEPGVSDVYIGGLWWLDQLGLLAVSGVEAVFRQTLAGMNYGMLDPDTLAPNPDYWNSLLWKKLMGTEVYRVAIAGKNTARVRAYAHSSPSGAGVTVLVINLDPAKKAAVSFKGLKGKTVDLYAVTAPDILGKEVRLNGERLELVNGSGLPRLEGRRAAAGDLAAVTVNPLSYTFVRFH